MARYSKYNSNYIKSNKHQTLKDGTNIFERDWVTIGSQLNFGPNKRPYYNNGNFIFTTSNIPNYKKYHKNGVLVGTWTYDDVKDAKSSETSNKIKTDENTEDIRKYAYYGSCVELVRTSVENIIGTFPGNISVSNEQITTLHDTNGTKEGLTFKTLDDYYKLSNPFEINVYDKKVQLKHTDNELRFLASSWKNYKISTDNGKTFTEISNYDITLRFLYENKVVDETTGKTFTYYQMFSDEEYEGMSLSDLGWVKSSCIMKEWLPDSSFYNPISKEEELYSKTSDLGINLPQYTVSICIKVKNEQNEEADISVIKIDGYIFNGEKIALVKKDYKDCIIQPLDSVIDEYFNNLEGFEKQLLNRKTIPLYSNRFITPIEYNLDYAYCKRTYTWPSNGYCIDITSLAYTEFLESLISMSEIFDEIWTDNLWQRMTHEAIKNYDWTYTKQYSEGEEEDNEEGGERMHKVLNIIARTFDNVKVNIDTIKQFNKITYNEDRNTPSALLKNNLEIDGWDVYSTIPNYTVENGKEIQANDVVLDDSFLKSNNIFWYKTKNNNMFSFNDANINFMRRLLLSSQYIFSSKGTTASIDMIMGLFGYGETDYDIKEEYRTVVPREYNENIGKEGNVKSLGDEIVRLNRLKQNAKIYDDDVTGIPVGSFVYDEIKKDTIEQTTYLIPFYTQEKMYDGDFTFQSKGGWFYNKDIDENGTNSFKWSETLSYLHVVSRIGTLLQTNPRALEEGDIYYVASFIDYTDYSENTEELKSNFFVVIDDYSPDKFSSWHNIDLTSESYTEDKGYTKEEIEKYKSYAEKANYLNNIIPYTKGNNPHVGYGKYDKGEEYFDYMKKPFKYAIDGNYFDYDSKNEADNIEFSISEPIVSERHFYGYGFFVDKEDLINGEINNEKSYTNESTKSNYEKAKEDYENAKEQYKKTKKEYENAKEQYEKGIPTITEEEYENAKEDYEKAKNEHERYKEAYKNAKEQYEKFVASDKIKIFANKINTFPSDENQYIIEGISYGGLNNLYYKSYDESSIHDMKKKIYFLNSKVITITNNIEGDNYKNYFKKVIMKYIMQVIPSTAIVILEGFE